MMTRQATIITGVACLGVSVLSACGTASVLQPSSHNTRIHAQPLPAAPPLLLTTAQHLSSTRGLIGTTATHGATHALLSNALLMLLPPA